MSLSLVSLNLALFGAKEGEVSILGKFKTKFWILFRQAPFTSLSSEMKTISGKARIWTDFPRHFGSYNQSKLRETSAKVDTVR